MPRGSPVQVYSHGETFQDMAGLCAVSVVSGVPAWRLLLRGGDPRLGGGHQPEHYVLLRFKHRCASTAVMDQFSVIDEPSPWRPGSCGRMCAVRTTRPREPPTRLARRAAADVPRAGDAGPTRPPIGCCIIDVIRRSGCPVTSRPRPATSTLNALVCFGSRQRNEGRNADFD